MHMTMAHQNLQTRINPPQKRGNLVEKPKSSNATSKIPKTKSRRKKMKIHAVGYSNDQQLEKNNKKKFGRMREILGAYRKKPITGKSLLWNFEKSISKWCVISLVTWPLRINNPFWNRFINGFITAISKKSTFPENPIGAQKSSE